MPVCYNFARWFYSEDTVHAGRAALIPRNKLALFRSPVRPGWLNIFETTGGYLPLNACSARCNKNQRGACRRRYGVVPMDLCVHAVATPGLKTGTV